MAEETWANRGYELFKIETSTERTGKPTYQRTKSFTTETIRKASLGWYKLKWQYSGVANNLWGEEVQGYAIGVEGSPLSDIEMFQHNHVSQIRLRLFNLSRGDDACNDFRGAFLKFGETQEEGPLDMAFTTGRMPCFHNVDSLYEFLTALDGDEDSIRDWAFSNKENFFALIDGVRQFPACWSELDYHNHETYVVGTGEQRKLVRFRLRGTNDVKSRLSATEQENACKGDKLNFRELRRPDIELPSDTYLTEKIRDVATQHRQMQLQVQIRDYRSIDKEELSQRNYWDEMLHPWENICTLFLTYSVPKVQFERAKYNFSQTSGLEILVPEGTDNFGNLIKIQEKVLAASSRRKHPEGSPVSSGKSTTYLIHAETGNQLLSGTDAGVYVVLYGTNGRSEKLLLDKLFHNDFERGSKESYYVTVPTIGDLKFIEIFLIGGNYTFARSWFLNNIVIFDLVTRKLFDIPCYRWIDNNITLLTGEGVLYQNEPDLDRRYLRRIYLQKQVIYFPWQHRDGLPGQIARNSYADLPMDLKYSTQRQIEKRKIIVEVLLKLKLHKYMTVFKSFESIDDFKEMANVAKRSETSKAIMETWQLDTEFGRQFLNGVNPVMIRRCSRPLNKMPVTDDMLSGILKRNMSLEEEMQAGHIYYVDYYHSVGVQRKSEEPATYLADPIVMFYVPPNGMLVPIAIQLQQRPGRNNPIWTPNDSETDWLLAKTFVKSSDCHYQTIYSHLTKAHLFMETFTIALLRQIPPNHPVYKLLIQHTRFTVAGAQKGRDLLLFGEDSLFGKILSIPGHEVDFIRNRYSDFHIDELFVPKDMKNRGVEDAKLLPNYFYRDDALVIWNKILEYVDKMLSLFYKTDNDIKTDHELQAFLKDLCENGLKKPTGSSPNGLPDSFNTRSDAVDFVTMIIFHSSCYHAAMNFAQEDYFSFGPNYPGALRAEPPKEKGKTDMQCIMDTLPSKSNQAITIAFAHFLSEPLSDEVYLGEYTESHFTEQEARQILIWFSDELQKISKSIHERNRMIDVPYVYLIPEQVPKSCGQ